MDLTGLAELIESYRSSHDRRLPSSLQDALDDDELRRRHYRGDSSIPLDPWEHEYSYFARDDGTFDLVCFGADGRRGGVGDDADIVWMPALSARLAQERVR